MRTSRITYAVVGALTASVAAGATAGGLVARRQHRAARTADPQRFDDLGPHRTSVVRTEDGVALHVEEVGPPDAPLTVVFAHGFTLSTRSFYFQRAALAAEFGDDLRLVFYDQRSHGRSAPSVPGSDTVEQLGRDLYTVLDAVVPTGPAVLVGHSMGGMTVLAMALGHPELFGGSGAVTSAPAARVVGVALLATSSGGLAKVRLGLPALVGRLGGKVTPLILRGARRQAALVEHSRRVGRDLAWVITRRFSFGAKTVSPDVVDFINEIISGTRVETIADFYPDLMTYDLRAALPVLRHTDVLIVGGEVDLVTPLSHSRLLADALPDAVFMVVPDAGHVLLLEQPQIVDEALIALVNRGLVSIRADR